MTKKKLSVELVVVVVVAVVYVDLWMLGAISSETPRLDASTHSCPSIPYFGLDYHLYIQIHRMRGPCSARLPL